MDMEPVRIEGTAGQVGTAGQAGTAGTEAAAAASGIGSDHTGSVPIVVALEEAVER